MKETSDTAARSPASGDNRARTGDVQQRVVPGTAGEPSLLDLWLILWRSRWAIIGITAIFAILSIPYALVQAEWYRSDVLLAPAEERSTSGLARQLGGLVGLAGVTVGGGGNVEPLAILQSRDFAAAFIEEHGLLPVLFPDSWDAVSGDWISADIEKQPDIRDAVETFRKKVLVVSEDSVTGLVSLSIRWTDPQRAAEWANLLVDQINEHLRQRALVEAESNIKYLQQELVGTNIVTLQESIGRLLEAELQKVMLARGNEEFAFRVIDQAQIPKTRFKPNRKLIVVLATFLGGFLSVLFVFTRHAVGAARARVVS
jgi:uncharacterized protein involved in exopolysaccharide biosynthesis